MGKLQEAETLYAAGDLLGSIRAIRAHLEQIPNDVQAWHRLSLLEEQVGHARLAGLAHHRCLVLAPNLAVAYIYAGSWIAESGNTEAAAAAFSIAFDLQPERFWSTGQSNMSGETRRRIESGSRLFTSFLAAQQESHGQESLAIANAEWVRVNAANPVVDINTEDAVPGFKPELFLVNGIRKKAYYDPSEFSWQKTILQAQEEIRSELNYVREKRQLSQISRPYLSKDSIKGGPLTSLAGSNSWSAIDLFRDGSSHADLLDFFPKTLKVLEKLPTYGLNDTPYEAFFSLLGAHQEIAPHYGQSNHSLTVHLNIESPSGAYLKVNGEQREWCSNELIVFDDSFIHSAHNPSSENRTILLFSIWHPDLNQQDREAVQRSFELRGKWLNERQNLIFDALPSL